MVVTDAVGSAPAVKISERLYADMVAYAQSAVPEIVGGLLIGCDSVVSQLYPCKASEVASEELRQAIPPELVAGENRIFAVYCSQCNGGVVPSEGALEGLAVESTYITISLHNCNRPDIRAWRITKDGVSRLEIEILQDPALSGDIRQILRREFARNRFLGWHMWLRLFAQHSRRHDDSAAQALIHELSAGGYGLLPLELDLLLEFNEFLRVQKAGVAELWAFYERRLQDCERSANRGAEALVTYRLGLVFQHLHDAETARLYYERSQQLWDRLNNSMEVQRLTDALTALDHEERTGASHESFMAVTKLLRDARIDADEQFQKLVNRALLDDNWRLGREAIFALDLLDDVSGIARALFATPQVQVAAITLLRKRGFWACRDRLLAALCSTNAFVRWQAALGLGIISLPTVDFGDAFRQVVPINHATTSRLAYIFWEMRGRPFGSPELDWSRAEERLREMPT